MPALPDNNTGRVWVDYTNSYDAHTFMWRFDESTATQLDVRNAIVAFLGALNDFIQAITIVGMRWSATGSNVSLPLALPADVTYGAGALNAGARDAAWEFLGRSATGRRSSFYLYAAPAVKPAGMRFSDTLDADLAAGIAQLVLATDGGTWVAVDNTILTVKNYTNYVVNDYWTHQIRA